MKKLLFILPILAISFISCEKEGPRGDKGDKGEIGMPGPGAINKEKTITFNAGSTSKLFGSFENFEKNDVILTYIKWDEIGGSALWTQVPSSFPALNVVFHPNFSELTGSLWIDVRKHDGGNGSPFTTSNTFEFRAIHIKANGLIENPNVDFSNYEEVKKAFEITE